MEKFLYFVIAAMFFLLIAYFYLKKRRITRFYRTKKNDVAIDEEKTTQSKYVQWTVNKIKKATPNSLESIVHSWIVLVKSPYARVKKWHYVVVEGAFAGIGFFCGFYLLKNTILGLLLTGTGLWIGFILLENRIQDAKRDKDEKLLLVIANLTAVYLRGDNFVVAVEDTLDSIPQPLHNIFVIFLYKIKYYGFESTHQAMADLAKDIDNYYFTELVHLIQQAENGETGLKYAIESIPEAYRDYIYINMQYRKTIEDINIQFLIRLLLLPIALGFVYLLGDNYFEILVNHFIGKTVLLVIFVIYVVSIYVYRKNNKDIILDL